MYFLKSIASLLVLCGLPSAIHAVNYDVSILRQLQTRQAVEDVRTLVNSVLHQGDAFTTSGDNPDATGRFNRYFPDTDQARALVKGVFKAIHEKGFAGLDGAQPMLNDLTISDTVTDNGKEIGLCTAENDQRQGYKTLAYLDQGLSMKSLTPTIVICPQGLAWDFQTQAKTVACEVLNHEVVGGMASLGSILLHELTHWNQLSATVSKSNPKGDSIRDVKFGPKLATPAYGPQHVWQMNEAPSNMKTATADKNADSYRWFALDHYYAFHCPNALPLAKASSNGDGACKPDECITM